MFFHLRGTTVVGQTKLKRIARTVRVLTLIALLAGLCFTTPDDLITLAMGREYGTEHHVDLLYEKV